MTKASTLWSSAPFGRLLGQISIVDGRELYVLAAPQARSSLSDLTLCSAQRGAKAPGCVDEVYLAPPSVTWLWFHVVLTGLLPDRQ